MNKEKEAQLLEIINKLQYRLDNIGLDWEYYENHRINYDCDFSGMYILQENIEETQRVLNVIQEIIGNS